MDSITDLFRNSREGDILFSQHVVNDSFYLQNLLQVANLPTVVNNEFTLDTIVFHRQFGNLTFEYFSVNDIQKTLPVLVEKKLHPGIVMSYIAHSLAHRDKFVDGETGAKLN